MKYRIPQYLHRPYQILFFDAEDVALIMLLFVLAMLFGYVFWFLLFVVPYVYMKVKKKYPRGFLKHIIYRLGIISFKGAPSVFERNFRE